MTAYHAHHEAPYDDACPDCNGYADAPDAATPARGCCIGLVLALPAWLVLGIALWGLLR